MSPRFATITFALTITTGCLPYTVGSTAQTVPAGERTRAAIVYYIPDAIDLSGDSVSSRCAAPISRCVTVSTTSPISASHSRVQRRRLHVQAKACRNVGTGERSDVADGGRGFINWGEHAEAELTLLASGRATGDDTVWRSPRHAGNADVAERRS
jgi:hypothetical protein